MGRPRSGKAPDRGQAIPVLVLALGAVSFAGVATATWGAQLAAGGRAAAAADAAALAGAQNGYGAAQAIAAANGARLVAWSAEDGPAGEPATDVTVTVEVDGPIGTSTAVARATTGP